MAQERKQVAADAEGPTKYVKLSNDPAEQKILSSSGGVPPFQLPR